MKHCKKYFLIIFIFGVLISCASSSGGFNRENENLFEDGLSLDDAIEQSAVKIIDELPIETRISIVAFSSEHDNLSNYIMDELTGALIDGNLEVADRRNLAYVYRELNFQMSGEVSDETAISIGKFLGAPYVITGQFVKVGGRYRYRLAGINVETAIQESSTRLNVRFDRTLQNFIADIKQMPVVTASADYGNSQNTLPKTAGAYLDRGILFASRGDYNMAVQEFTEAIKLDNKLSSAYLLRGRAYFATASYVTSVGENFGNVTTTITNGMNVSSDKQILYDRSIEDFTQAIRLDPNSAQAYRERGVAYSDRGDQNHAIMDLDQAIRLSPNYILAYNNRGNIYRRRGEYDRAIADYNYAIRLDPNFARAYMNRGGTYRNKGDYNRAIADHTQAIQLAPNDAVTYNERAGDYYDMSNYDRAITDYTQAIRLDPNHPVTYGNRGSAYFAKGDYIRAIADYETALRIDPNNTVMRNSLEYIRQQRGQ
jgi:tetratricopeptide (TPR) repeat protein